MLINLMILSLQRKLKFLLRNSTNELIPYCSICFECKSPVNGMKSVSLLSSFHGHAEFANIVKSSGCMQSLPPLRVECLELDGDYTTLPIIFEDMYCDHVPVSSGG